METRMFASLLVGCGSTWEVEAELPPDPPPALEDVAPKHAFQGTPVAGWDPWRARWEDGASRMPVIVREDGFQAPMVLAFDEETWAPTPQLPVGVHTIDIGADDPQPFEVADWGQVPGFDSSVLEGRAWRIVHLGVSTGGMEDLLLQLLVGQGIVLRIPDVRGDNVTVELWATGEDTCRVFGADAEIDPRGKWMWAEEAVEIEASPEPIAAWDLRIGGGADASGGSIGGVYAHLVVDTAPISAQLSEDGDTELICGLAAGLGSACAPCPEGDSDACLTLDVSGAQFEEAAFFEDDGDTCGVDLSEDIPQLDCDIELDLDLDLCSLLAFPFMGTTLTVALRRRRKG